jgi:CRISPR-associated protein Cas2
LTSIPHSAQGDQIPGLNTYVVSYDIRDAKRLRMVYKRMREFGSRIHYSVFRCDLSRADLVVLRSAISEIIDRQSDRVMIIDLGPCAEGAEKRIEFIGQRPDEEPLYEVII